MADEQNELNALEEPETGEDYDEEEEDQGEDYDEEEENEDEEAEIELGSEDSEEDEVSSNCKVAWTFVVLFSLISIIVSFTARMNTMKNRRMETMVVSTE